jgi:tRNA/tmRNA/rRNA uracil-C5-methylase (TrmA/RlmC/RlmD family)
MESFQKTLEQALSKCSQRRLPRGECQTPDHKNCTLCNASRIDYAEESRIKADVIRRWWSGLALGVDCEPLVLSPGGRRYRTVTKRKVFHGERKTTLGLIGLDEERKGAFPIPVIECAIEPENHARVYTAVQEFVSRPEESSLAEVLSYVVIKGGSNEVAVILNMTAYPHTLIRSVKSLSRHLTTREKSVKSLFVFVGEERSDYYLSRPSSRSSRPYKIALHKIFGFSELFHTVESKRYFYSPLSFSQTNHQILDLFVGTIRSMLALQPEDRLLDLYCGYGLFSLALSGLVRTAIGVDVSAESIQDAISNAERLGVKNCRFMKNDVSLDSIGQILFKTAAHRKVGTPKDLFDPTFKCILDPPRGGTSAGVIESIAGARPAQVVHIFCNPDIIANELERWKSCGYVPEQAVPIDMFPGTNGIEIVVELKPLRS